LHRDKNDSSFAPGSRTAREDIRGEEMTEQYLIKCGGQAYQSDIVTESGLSKSKISSVLSNMKKEGRIIKIKKAKKISYN
jgi:predicted transcriptional regulator